VVAFLFLGDVERPVVVEVVVAARALSLRRLCHDGEVTVNQELIRAAADQADRRWPDRDAVGAAVGLKDGSILTGVPFSNFNAVMVLCAETGPICAAYTNGQTVIASVCVSRDYASGEVTVIAPCGACQERRALWGPQVQVGGPTLQAQSAGPAGAWST
jgi:cytidine deaminase